MMLSVGVLFLFLTVSYAVQDKCPKMDVKTCLCKTYFNGACIIACSLSSQEDLDKIADIENLCEGNVHFVLVHSNVEGIPSKLWKTLLSSKTVDVSIKHSVVDGLVRPSDEPFSRVYTSGSAVIKIDHTKVKNWDWKPFSKFYSEDELTIVVDDTEMPELSMDFSTIANGQVHKVTIDSAQLPGIDNQLKSFEGLNSLSLQNNKLTSVSRSILARPAEKLQFLHLNGNLLTTVPGDLFVDMPNLQVVYLRDNQLKSLPQDLFKSINSRRLQRVDLVHNPWECDCRLMWILQNSKRRWNMGTCSTPDNLAGEKIRNLHKLLQC